MSLTLLLGGAASGKSRMAAERIGSLPGPWGLIATAEPGDQEMEAKIERHRRNRPAGWAVVEEPLDLVAALDRLPDGCGLVVDCLTLWVSNLVGRGVDDGEVLALAEAAAGRLATRGGETVVVSNEVGSGIVPVDALARRYRELLGRVNSVCAKRADRVLLVVAGGVTPVLPVEEAWND